MESIGMGDSSKCPLCTRVEDNEHRVKQCPYLEMPIQLVRDLYHPIRDKQGARIEPSRICLEHQQESLESEQGILMWTAIAALWRYRCEVRYQRTTPTRQGFMGWWDGELWRWGQEETTAVPVSSIQRARKAIRSWLQNKGRLDRRADPGIPKEQNKKKAQEERKKELKKKVIEKYNLLEPPEEGVQRVWTDGSQQAGTDGRQYAGYGAWFGEGHALNFSAPLQGHQQTNNRAEMMAAIEVLGLVPR